MAIAGNAQTNLSSLMKFKMPSAARVLLTTAAVAVLVLSPLRVNLQTNDSGSTSLTGTQLVVGYSEAQAADRRGGRSGDRSGRGGGKGADRRGLDRNDTPGASDSASSSGRSDSSSSSGSSSSETGTASANESQSADTTGAGNEAGGSDAAESEGGDRSPRSWFSIDASDMDTLNVGVIASRMGKAPSAPTPDPCAAHICHDVR